MKLHPRPRPRQEQAEPVLSPTGESVSTPGPSQDPASPLGWFPAKFVEVLDERSKEVRGEARKGALELPPPQAW